MKVIVGLGNPDKKYAKTLHNIGFMAIDRLAEKLGVDFNKKAFKGVVAEYRKGGEKFILLKPSTYMNLSGDSVREALDFYKLTPNDIIVIYDDLDLNVGSLRIREKGSAGTHNGMRDIVNKLNSTEFIRFRIGTKPIGGYEDIINFVLSNIRKEDEKSFEEVFNKVVYGIISLINGDGIDKVMRECRRYR